MLVLGVAAAPFAAAADSLDAILARMDASAKKFQSVTATLTQSEYTAVIKQMDGPDAGELKIKRSGGHVSALLSFTGENAHTLAVKGNTGWQYYPKAKTVDEYSLAKYAGTIDQFLLLAFGTSGSDLRKTYDVSLGGTDSIKGIQAARLVLKPKTEELKKVITMIELWIPEGQAAGIQEKVTEPSGNYILAEYSNVKMNPNLPDSAFDLKLPKDVQVRHPQK